MGQKPALENMFKLTFSVVKDSVLNKEQCGKSSTNMTESRVGVCVEFDKILSLVLHAGVLTGDL